MVVVWVNDPSSFPLWVDDPVWVGDPEDVVVAFLVIGSGRASRTSLPFVLDLPPLPEELDTLGGIGNFHLAKICFEARFYTSFCKISLADLQSTLTKNF